MAGTLPEGLTQEEFDNMPAPMREQILESEAMMAEFAKANEAAENGNSGETAPDESAPAPEPTAEVQPEPETPVAENPSEPAPTPAEPAPVADEAATLRAEMDKLQHSFQVEKGRLRAEAEAKRQLQQQLAEAQAKLAEAAKTPPAPPKPLKERIKPEVLDGIPVETVEEIARVIREDVERDIAAREDKLKNVDIGEVHKTLAQIRHGQFLSELSAAVPTAMEINDSDAFQQWLGELDPMSGVVRDDLLKRAQDTFNAKQAAAIFKTFLGTQTHTETAPAAPTAPQKPVTPVAAQVRPAAAAPAPPPPKKHVWTMAEIDDFQADVMRGRTPKLVAQGKFKSVDAMQKDIDAAYVEGRFR